MLNVDIGHISTKQQQVVKAANMLSVQPHVGNLVQLFSSTNMYIESP